MCSDGLHDIIETFQVIPEKLQDRVLQFSKHVETNSEELEDAESAGRLHALRVIATNLKYYMFEVGEQIKTYISEVEIPDITLSSLMEHPDEILHDVT